MWVHAEEDDSGHEVLTKRARHLNRSLNQFWTRWRREYLLELREAHRQHQGHTNPTPVSVDDIVVVHAENQPRGFWRLGKITELVKGCDGNVRGAIVRVPGKGRQATSLHRPLQLLYPLEEPHPPLEFASSDSPQSTDTVTTDNPKSTRSVVSSNNPLSQRTTLSLFLSLLPHWTTSSLTQHTPQMTLSIYSPWIHQTVNRMVRVTTF